MRRWFEQEYVLKDFEGVIKSYATRDFIYFFAEKSIEIYKNQVESWPLIFITISMYIYFILKFKL